MKIRLVDNEIRIRVTLNEIETLSKGDTVSTSLDFGEIGMIAWYLVPAVDVNEIGLALAGSRVTITLPEHWTAGWEGDDRVGFEAQIEAGRDQNVKVVIEKDFRCRHPKDGV